MTSGERHHLRHKVVLCATQVAVSKHVPECYVTAFRSFLVLLQAADVNHTAYEECSWTAFRLPGSVAPVRYDLRLSVQQLAPPSEVSRILRSAHGDRDLAAHAGRRILLHPMHVCSYRESLRCMLAWAVLTTSSSCQ